MMEQREGRQRELMTRLRGKLSDIELEFERLLADNETLQVENVAWRAKSEEPAQPKFSGAAQSLKESRLLHPKTPENSGDWPYGGQGHGEVENISWREKCEAPEQPNSCDTAHSLKAVRLMLPTITSLDDPRLDQAERREESPAPALHANLPGPVFSVDLPSMPASPCISCGTTRELSAQEEPRPDETLQLWSAWNERTSRMQRSISRSSSRNNGTMEILRDGVKRAGDALRSNSWVQRFITKPSSAKRILWDLLSVTVMAYDLITIPLELFELPDSLGMYAASMLTTVFWTCDVLLSFVSGYHSGGLIEMRPQKVAFHYLRTWFAIDVVVVTVDWTVFIVDSNSMDSFGMIRLNKTLRIVRILRVLRMLRLLRMLKVMSVITELSDMIHSETVLTSINIISFIFGILLLSHYIACSWYGVGNSQVTEDSDPRDSWVTRLQLASGLNLGTHSRAYYYVTALHWSLTQFTPASMEVVPCNTVERLFTIGVIVVSVIIFSSVLSSITAAMINLRRKSAEKRRQIGFVRRYITDKHVTNALGNRIVGFLRQHNYNVSQRQSLHEEHIAAFKILPDSLKTQLRCEVFLPTLIPHPLFFTINRMDYNAMIAICTTAMSEHDLSVGQEMFSCGKKASRMFALMNGNLTYFQGDQVKIHEDVEVGTFICEAVLWVIWEHRGRLVASTASDLVGLNAESFQGLMGNAQSRPLCGFYAIRYREVLLEWESQDFDMLTDISEVDRDMHDMVKAAYAKWGEVSDAALMEYVDGGPGNGFWSESPRAAASPSAMGGLKRLLMKCLSCSRRAD